MPEEISNPLLSLIRDQSLIDDLQYEEVLGEFKRSAKPVMRSVSTKTAQSVAGPVAGVMRPVGIFLVKRCSGSNLSMPITES